MRGFAGFLDGAPGPARVSAAIDPARLAALARMPLTVGAHTSRATGMCALEAVAWLARLPHSDQPACVSPLLGGFVRFWNDHAGAASRERLRDLLPDLVGTYEDGRDEARAWLAADWLTRSCAPAWLEGAGLDHHAARLRHLPALDPATVALARRRLALARRAAGEGERRARAHPGDLPAPELPPEGAVWAAVGAAAGAGRPGWYRGAASAWGATWAAMHLTARLDPGAADECAERMAMGAFACFEAMLVAPPHRPRARSGPCPDPGRSHPARRAGRRGATPTAP